MGEFLAVRGAARKPAARRRPAPATARDMLAGEFEITRLCRWYVGALKGLSIDPMLGVLGARSPAWRRRYFLGLLMRLANVRDGMLKSAPWQERFAAVRAALREAKRLRGRPRTDALVGVCRMLIDAEEDPPVPWEKRADGSEWRMFNARTRPYDRAEMRLELLVSRAVGGHCPGCFLDEQEERPRRADITGTSSTSRRSRD